MNNNSTKEPKDIRFFGSSQYYKNEEYSIDISFKEKILKQSTSLTESQNISFVFVQKGNGTLSINNDSFRLCAGNGYLLSFSDYYQYNIEKNSTLELLIFQTNTWSYLLSINCPRYPSSLLEITSTFQLLTFDHAETETILSFWERYCYMESLPGPLGLSSKFYSLMEITGIYLRKINRNILAKEEQPGTPSKI